MNSFPKPAVFTMDLKTIFQVGICLNWTAFQQQWIHKKYRSDPIPVFLNEEPQTIQHIPENCNDSGSDKIILCIDPNPNIIGSNSW